MTAPVRKAGYEVKAAAFRGYVEQLEKLGVLAAVREKVPEETRRAIDSPPLPSAWIDAMIVEDIIEGLQALRGIEGVRMVTSAGQKSGVARVLIPVAGALMRIFGTRPDTLLARFDDMTKTVIRGVDLQWVLDTPTSGHLKVKFPRKNVPRHVFIGMESGCWLILELCHARGTVKDTEIVNEGTTGVIRVSWSPS